MADTRPLASPAEVAEYLGVSVQKLADFRYRGIGPEFVKVGPKHVRYRWGVVEAWLNTNTRQSTGAA